MNRNSKSHFSATDNRINIGRSRFERPSWFKTTMATGKLIPFYVDEVLPGDTFEMKTSVLCRMATPLFPVMDNAYLDTYFFFVPNRLVWDHWKQFNGENDINAWEQVVDYQIPQTPILGGYRDDILDDGVTNSLEYSLFDYMGLPIHYPQGNAIELVSALPLRAYQLVWNEWFRDQNLQDPIYIPKDDSYEMSDVNHSREMATVRRVCKFKDYFTSALPAPQRGSAVLIPGFDGSARVGTLPASVINASTQSLHNATLKWYGINDSNLSNGGDLSISADGGATRINGVAGDVGTYGSVAPSNLGILKNTGVTIDALRTAFQIQKLLWRDGNGGTRYTEIIRSHFGVVSPDARLQRPEYLGGKRIPITVNQVIQQSANADEPSPLGNTGAVSKTVDSFNGFTKSFTEHGILLGVCCIRTDHTYQDGINRMWSRKDRFDFYYPELAHIGEQAILNKEIYYQDIIDGPNVNNEVFGYQEAWAEYRYRPSFVTGAFRSQQSGGSLDSWHYADDYRSLPHLSAKWIEEPSTNVERTLAVQSNPNEQWLLDFYFDLKTTRPMPVYSVPGLVDHF